MAETRLARRAFGRSPTSDRGQSLVEVALALPLLVFTLLGGADMARAFAVQLAVQNGARAAAESTALQATPTGLEASAHAQDEMNRTPGMNVSGACTQSGTVWTCGGATVTVAFTQADGTSTCTGASSTAVAGTSSVATPCYAKVRVQYAFSTIVPWPGLPHTFQLDRTTMYRRYE
ncbi:MAG: pilus assembly protein [Chloroflexota bacterium]|nr:pilus assembly protein [Chloroflexota bacterium]MDE3193881.1 pilus assembly protein [Chloroflexota bacterium]